MNHFTCLIMAAGKGKRFGFEKQWFTWHSRMLWQYSYQAAVEVCNNVVIVGMDIDGSRTRQQSVAEALRSINTQRVVIIDASTPLVSEENILALANSKEKSITFGRKPSSNILLNREEYINLDSTMLIQTPQAFDTHLLRTAHKLTKITDAQEDTCIMKEVHNIKPCIITAPPALRNVIYPTDLELLEGLF